MIEMESTSTEYDQNFLASRVRKVDEVDNLSTNIYKQMDREKEEMEEETGSPAALEDILQMNSELQTGYKILMDLMSDSKKAVNWPFMESVETTAPDLYEDYRKRIEKPMWLKLMKQKYEDKQYETITEFVSDFRGMLENCYRYNGPDHYVSRRGQKLETMLEQKLNLLSRELREKTSIEATSGFKSEDGSLGLGLRRRPKAIIPHDSTTLLNQLREEEQQKVRESRRQQMLDRKAEKEALVQEILDWEDTVLFAGKYKQQMKAMWEIPQIGLFLFLCQGPLNIGEVMHFELERCFLIPRESSTMQLIMMSLLSTPFQRMKIDRKYLMPYKVWEQKLSLKMQCWYKVFTDSGYDVEKACTKLGFDERFFEILGKKNPMAKKKYHELGFYKKVWVVKGLCDHLLQTQESLRETIELQPFTDQREYLLGTDGDGLRYIHFPQFCGADLRIYRQAPFKYPKLEIKEDPFESKRKFPFVYKPPPLKKAKIKKKKSKKKQEMTSPVQSPLRSRPSRLRQTPKNVIPLNYGDTSESSDTSSDEADTINDTTTELEESVDREEESDRNDLSSAADIDTKSETDRLSSGSDATIPYCDKSDSNSCASSRDCSRESSPYQTPTNVNMGLRRSSRFDKSSDVSREASPLINESDFVRRSSRNLTRFKDIPPLRATRDLTSFLLDENSTTSNSSAFGENSYSGIWKNGVVQTENSVSSDTGEDSNNCDIGHLFSTSKLGRNRSSQSGKKDSVSKELTSAESIASKTVTDVVSGFTEEMEVEDRLNDLYKEGEIVNSNIEKEADKRRNLKSVDRFDGSRKYTDPDKSKKRINGSELTEPEQNDKTSNNAVESEFDTCESNTTAACNTQVKTEIKDIYSAETFEGSDSAACEKNDIKSANDHVEDTIGEHMECESLEDIDRHTEPGNTETEGEMNDTSGCGETNPSTDVNLNLSNTKTRHEENHSECDKSTGSHLSDHFLNKETDGTHLDIPYTNSFSVKSAVTAEQGAGQSVSLNQGCVAMEGGSGLVNQVLNKNSEDNIQAENMITAIKEEPMETVETDIGSSKEAKILEMQTRTVNGNVKIEELENDSGQKCSSVYDNIKHEEGESDLNDRAANRATIKVEPGEYENKESVKTESDLDIKTEPLTGSEEQGDEKQENKVKEEIKEESEEEEEEEEKVPDLGEFELLADSVEALRMLTEEFAEQEPIIIRRGKKEQVTRPPPRKKNVIVLHERLAYLLKELEPWEFKLVQATKRARIRLRKEMESYVEPPHEEESKWNSTDEETESGESDDDSKTDGKDADKAGKEDANRKTKAALEKVLSADNSRASTPMKLEETDEIDVSQRGRLRKRRIIPNNVEDQFAVKKSRPVVKSEPLSTSEEPPQPINPVVVQSGKPQLVDYSDILRQIRSANAGTVSGVSPILIKTTQGGRTVLTSVLPIASGSGTGGNVTNLQGLQNIRFLSPPALSSPSAGQQAVRLGAGLGQTKVSQHPMIQTLLSTTSAPGMNVVPQTNTTSSIMQLLPKVTTKATGALTGALQTVSLATGQQIVMKPQGPGQSQTVYTQQHQPSQKIVLQGQGQTTPQKVVLQQQTTTLHKVGPQGHITPPKTSADLQVTPRKIAPHTSAPIDQAARGKVKYYAANASTLPINVVQQLLATRGAKLQTGPNQQSILFIPMESEGQTRNVTSVTKNTLTPIKHDGSETSETGPQLTSGSSTDNGVKSVTQSKVLTTVTNTPILPKPQAGVSGSPVVTLAPGIQLQPALHIQTGAQTGNQSNLVKVSKTVRLPDGSISLNVLAAKNLLPPTSPPRYPTNETVRNLLDKRKYGEEKVYPSTTYPCIASQLQGITPKPLSSSVILKGIPATTSPESHLVTTTYLPTNQGSMTPLASAATPKMLDHQSMVSTATQQQCVITSISPAKLNTLLQQTNAAGAKTIPSLIKLPSKAVLDSAVKAVVTSVTTSLPTVNIKVPSPTSLPSISPRRNITKTIQTMKSPIPVAPKVVTQNSGISTLSVGSAHTAMLSSKPVSTLTGKAMVTTASPLGLAQPTVMQTIDGKKVLAKMTPQTVLTSKGIVQMGYLTPQGMVIPKTQGAGNQSASQVLNHIGLQQTETGNQALQGMQLVQNSAGQFQLVPRTSPLLQQMSQKTNLLQLSVSAPHNTLTTTSTLRPLQSLGTVGSSVGPTPGSQAVAGPSHMISTTTSPVLLPRSTAMFTTNPAKSPVLGLPASISPVLSVPVPLKSPVLRARVDSKSPTSAMGAGYILPQSASGVLNSTPSTVTTQNPASPMLTMQQNLLLQGSGLQLANPAHNPLGLLQHGVAMQSPTLLPNSQNLHLLQNSLSSPALQQMVNVNPLLLSQLVASSGNVIMNRNQLPISTVSMAGKGTNLVTSISQASQLNQKSNVVYQTNASSVLSGAAKQVANLVNRVPIPSINVGQSTLAHRNISTTMNSTPRPDSVSKQFIFQYNVPNQRVSAVLPQSQVPTPTNVVKNLNTTFGSFGQDNIKASSNLLAVAQTQMNDAAEHTVGIHAPVISQVVNQQAGTPIMQSYPVASPAGTSTKSTDTNSKTSPGHQKLLLFSIGGQLVTGQGVPVTLSDGVLKLMPQGKIQIANQTLTPAQIQQTLAKINQGLNTTTASSLGQQQQQQQQSYQNVVSAIRPAGQTSSMTPTAASQAQAQAQYINSCQAQGPLSTSFQAQAQAQLISSSQAQAQLISSSQAQAQLISSCQAQAQPPSFKYKDHDYQHRDKPRPVSSPSSAANTASIPLSIAPDTRESSQNSTSYVVSDSASNMVQQEDCSESPTGSELMINNSGEPTYVMPRSNNTQYVMKPMVYSSGYIVCPRTEKDKESAAVPVVTDINKTQEVFRKAKFVYGNEKEGFIVKAPVKTEVNGKRDLKSPDSFMGANEMGTCDDDDDDERESNLVIDDGLNEKEAALNLLTLANQALAPVKVRADLQVDQSGDAPENFTSSR